MAAIFLDLPDRQEFPDYYKAIKLPISLNEIEVSNDLSSCGVAEAWPKYPAANACGISIQQSKMIARPYGSPDQFYQDVDLMCNNAMFYNEDGSMVYNDAQQIKVCPP